MGDDQAAGGRAWRGGFGASQNGGYHEAGAGHAGGDPQDEDGEQGKSQSQHRFSFKDEVLLEVVEFGMKDKSAINSIFLLKEANVFE